MFIQRKAKELFDEIQCPLKDKDFQKNKNGRKFPQLSHLQKLTIILYLMIGIVIPDEREEYIDIDI